MIVPEFTECPEPGCFALAEVVDVFELDSTSGPVTHVATLCVADHRRIHTTN